MTETAVKEFRPDRAGAYYLCVALVLCFLWLVATFLIDVLILGESAFFARLIPHLRSGAIFSGVFSFGTYLREGRDSIGISSSQIAAYSSVRNKFRFAAWDTVTCIRLGKGPKILVPATLYVSHKDGRRICIGLSAYSAERRSALLATLVRAVRAGSPDAEIDERILAEIGEECTESD